jgi:predicted nucleic acid-binding protein
MRLFLDANVRVSAFAGSSLCGELIAQALEGHVILRSDLVTGEVLSAIDRKLRLSETERRLAGALVVSFSERVEDVLPGEPDTDARLVACASAAGADVFVTGDKRVLGWQRSGDMRILAPREVWVTLAAPRTLSR